MRNKSATYDILIIYINSNLENNIIYRIDSLANNCYFNLNNNILELSNKFSLFRLIQVKQNLYYIEAKDKNLRLGIDNKNNIAGYNKNKNANSKLIWKIINIDKKKYFIVNTFNNKFIEVINNKIISSKVILNFRNFNEKIENYKYFIFNFFKFYEEYEFKKENLKFIQTEPIDLIIKYIDLSDKSLNRKGIKQIYKDENNEELRYSMRSIFQYIPWIHKIYIIMPNQKVNFLKSIEEIQEKIIYINDKQFLGFDSANIFSFTFNLFRLKIFGVSNNFIYMEDDFFIGKPLKKKDFFYYDIETKKVLPFVITKYFFEMNKKEVLRKYDNYFQIKDSIHPHSRYGWWFSIFSTNKYILERYNITLINTLFTHNALAKNIDDLKDIFNEIKGYQYINETLYSKERHILTLNQPHFFNLYQLNVNHRKVHSIEYKYYEVEFINKVKLNKALFVINTGGNHVPLMRHYKIQKKIMKKRYPYYVKYEIRCNDYRKIAVISFLIVFKCGIIIFIFKMFINI